jgi:hypothetical protein
MFCIGRYFQALEQINKVLGLCDVISSTKVQKIGIRFFELNYLSIQKPMFLVYLATGIIIA